MDAGDGSRVQCVICGRVCCVQVAQVRREERRLKVRCVELAETITAKRAEAEAGLSRQRKLKAEVEQLRAAVEASEKADSARMQELHAQVCLVCVLCMCLVCVSCVMWWLRARLWPWWRC